MTCYKHPAAGSVNIWYSVIIHEESNDFLHSACAVRGSFAKFRIAERAKRFIDEYLSVFKAKNEKKIIKHNQPYEIEIREVDIKEKKRVKIHYKGFPEDTDEWRDYGDDLLLFVRLVWPRRIFCVFTFCTSASLDSKFWIDISVRFSIRSTTLPVIFLLPCSHVNKPFAVQQYWSLLFKDVQNTGVNSNIASTRFFKNSFHDSGYGGLINAFCIFNLLG